LLVSFSSAIETLKNRIQPAVDEIDCRLDAIFRKFSLIIAVWPGNTSDQQL